MPASRCRFVLPVVIFLLSLSSCNMPNGETLPTQSAAGAIYTAAAQTVQAQLTEVSQPPPTANGQTLPPPATATGSPPAGTTPAGTVTPGGPTGTAQACDRAKFVEDVTYPDNTKVAPGQTFIKTWRLQNDGTCTWDSAYSVVFSGGDQMGAPASFPLTTGSVAPGEKVDVSVTLQAPEAAGTFRSEWKLRNAANAIFGLGSDGSKPFWAQVDVVVASGNVYDFLAKASSADWVSGVGNEAGDSLAFGGEDSDPNGVAAIKDRVRMETSAISGKVLLTVPRHDADGFIAGTYPAYTVQPGDHLKARLGFLTPDGSCGSGKVKFQIYTKIEGATNLLQQWNKICDGHFILVDLDLNSLKGKSVRFMFVVRAQGTTSDNWAIWNSTLIEN